MEGGEEHNLYKRNKRLIWIADFPIPKIHQSSPFRDDEDEDRTGGRAAESGEKYDPGGFPEDESAGGCGIIGRERRGAAARESQRLSLSVCEN